MTNKQVMVLANLRSVSSLLGTYVFSTNYGGSESMCYMTTVSQPSECYSFALKSRLAWAQRHTKFVSVMLARNIESLAGPRPDNLFAKAHHSLSNCV